MLQLRRDANFTEKSRRAYGRGQFLPQHLDRDWAIMLEIAGQIDHCHSASPYLALDAVSVAEHTGEAVERSTHGADAGKTGSLPRTRRGYLRFTVMTGPLAAIEPNFWAASLTV